MSKHDAVNHPSHYTTGKVEVIEYIEDKLTPEQLEGYFVGNVLKYVSRYRHKGGVEDLRKASWYLDRLISKLDSPERKEQIGQAYAEMAELPPEEHRCHWMPSRECHNSNCRINPIYKYDCKNEFFRYHIEPNKGGK